MGFAFIIATAFFHGWPVLVKGIIIQQLKMCLAVPLILFHFCLTILQLFLFIQII